MELTKFKITVVINLKWPNLDYPCYLVGRTHKISCDHQTQYSLSGILVHDYENWPVIVYYSECKLLSACIHIVYLYYFNATV